MVVMKLGVVQQIGEPQSIYDNPANLFVAKFLGTPPINVFNGEVREGELYVGDEAVLDVPEIEDRKVFVGIRPEGFIYDENGAMTLDVTRIEVMGRDKSVVSTHNSAVSETIRTIIDSDVKLPQDATKLAFNLKPNKVHLFDAETEERIK
jgi:multiple sugar transport system ATP-binding protein